ncbi:MAG: hypothetical protein L3J73_03205, partial [Thermoplasmata archaeon]|nr:hypothetical protein [Thermoplasmata archaeon]
MSAPDPAAPTPLLTRSSSDPSTPILLTGLAAAAILSADGELRAPRETRGGMVEWGGTYAQGIRLTGPWTVTGEVAGARYDLPGTLTALSAWRWQVESEHRWGPVRVRQRLLPLPSEPAVARTLELTAASPVRVRLTHRIQPFLAPVLVEGIKPYSYRVTARGRGLEARAFGSAFLIAPSRPGDWTLDGTPWSGTEQRGEFGTISLSQEIDVGPAPVEVSWIVGGGLAGTVDRGPDLLATAASPPSEWARAAIRTWTSWRSGVPTMELPDAPRLERAYDLAASALRTLYSNPSPEITGLVAGFPWYPALWGRDLAWMLPAVLWLGDLGWAEASIRTMFRFQATSNIPLLGAEVGEIPMQISPGPVFLYGTSDTSLYYPDLVRRLVDHGGPIAAADEFWPHLRAIARWAEGKTDRASGLFTNGGEV